MQSWQTTTILLNRLRDLDDDAWTAFVERFRAPITRFARKLALPEHAADDVAQNALAAFVRAYREGRYDRDRARLRTWLFAIAHKEAMRMRRDLARAPRQAPSTDADAPSFFANLPDEDSLQSSWDEQWERHALERCLAQARAEFEPSTYEAFDLVALRSVPAQEVATRLGISRNAVYVAKHRVLTRLAELQSQFEAVA